jgi:hypothetical protein
MPRPLFIGALLGLGAVIAASCASSTSQAGRYPLTRGSSISIVTDTGGASTIAVMIPAGSPGAGEHVSTAEALVEPAREAKNALNEPGRITVVELDADGRLVAIETAAQVAAK